MTHQEIQVGTAIIAVKSIIHHIATKFNVDEATALKMIQDNLDQPYIRQLIEFAGETLGNQKAFNAIAQAARS